MTNNQPPYQPKANSAWRVCAYVVVVLLVLVGAADTSNIWIPLLMGGGVIYLIWKAGAVFGSKPRGSGSDMLANSRISVGPSPIAYDIGGDATLAAPSHSGTDLSARVARTVVLEVVDGPHRNLRCELPDGETRIGRDAAKKCVVLLDHDREVSGYHASIFMSNGRLHYRDDSRNGSLVNGQRLHHGECEVRCGAQVKIGATLFRLAEGSSAPAQNAHVLPGQPSALGYDKVRQAPSIQKPDIIPEQDIVLGDFQRANAVAPSAHDAPTPDAPAADPISYVSPRDQM